jgi:hypothetical protein
VKIGKAVARGVKAADGPMGDNVIQRKRSGAIFLNSVRAWTRLSQAHAIRASLLIMLQQLCNIMYQHSFHVNTKRPP